MATPIKAATYARFSTDRQQESSIEDQVRICSEYAAKNGMRVTASFEDQGISGAALGNRPGVLAMQEAALAHQFDVLLVTDLQRLSRAQGDLSKMIDRLTAKGIHIIGVQDGYDNSRKGHKLQAGISGITGESFREMVKERTYSALESRAKTQRPTGGRAYGYTSATKAASGKVEISDVEARTVRDIFRLYAEGKSERDIAGRLNERSVPSPGSSWNRVRRRANGWMGSGIRSMLRNPIYVGEVIWNQSQWVKDPDTGTRKRIDRAEKEWIRHVDESLRIVDQETWDKVAARIASHKPVTRHSGRAKYLLSGLLRCHACGAHYILADARSYACSGHIGGKACKNTSRVRRDVLEGKLLGEIKTSLLDPKMLREMATLAHKRMNAAGKVKPTAKVTRELQDVEDRIARYDSWVKAGHPDLTRSEIATMRKRAVEQRKELQAMQPTVKAQSASVARLVPDMAKRLVAKIEAGMVNPAHVPTARRVLLEVMGGPARLRPAKGGELYAEFALHPAVLVHGGHSRFDGSGGRI